MFKINTIQTTKSGEKLMPFTVDGDIVSCFTKDKKVVYRKLSDFDFTPEPKPKEVVVVNPVEDKSTDQLFTPEEDDSTNEDVLEEPVEDTAQDTTEEPVEDTTTEPESSGSIWDNINDDNYI